MDTHDSKNPKDKKPGSKPVPKITRKKLDRFLSSLCESAGMTGGRRRGKKPGERKKRPLACKGPCGNAEWRAHLDIPSGILCVSADWSKNRHADKHRDVTVAITYYDEKGREDYADMLFCDSEVRWLLETLWHAPIWEE